MDYRRDCDDHAYTSMPTDASSLPTDMLGGCGHNPEGACSDIPQTAEVRSQDGVDSVTILTTKGGLRATKLLELTSSGWLVTPYDRAAWFSVEERQVGNIFDLAALLTDLERRPHSFIVRGQLLEGIDRSNARRLLHDRTVNGVVTPATLRACARRWIPLDIDSLPLPDGLDPLAYPEAAVRYVLTLLPDMFTSVTVWWCFTSTMGIKPGLRMRLFFWSARPISDEELKRLLCETVPVEGLPRSKWRQLWPIDGSLYNPAQAIYTAHPIVRGGADPVPVRSGILVGDCHEVTPPTILRPEPPTGGKRGRRVDGGNGPVTSRVTGSGTAAVDSRSTAVGYAEHRSLIGDHEGGGGFHGPIKSAVAAHFARHGSRTDDEWLAADLETAIRAAVRNPAWHTAEYLEMRIADLPGLIASVTARQVARKAKDWAVLDHPPTYPDVGVDLTEGERLIQEAVERFMSSRAAWAAVPAELRGEPPRLALIATLGIGKTEVVAKAIGKLPIGCSVNVLAPDHALGRELTARLATAAPGHRVIQVLGREAVDADGEPMCHQRDLVAQWSALGGSVQSGFCRATGEDGSVEECPHFACCRYQAQRADDAPAIRVGSHAYLALAPEFSPLPAAADLMVIDENPVDTLTRASGSVTLDDVWSPSGRQVLTHRRRDHVDQNANFNEFSLVGHVS